MLLCIYMSCINIGSSFTLPEVQVHMLEGQSRSRTPTTSIKVRKVGGGCVERECISRNRAAIPITFVDSGP